MRRFGGSRGVDRGGDGQGGRGEEGGRCSGWRGRRCWLGLLVGQRLLRDDLLGRLECLDGLELVIDQALELRG